jgi:hypothetical protein
MTKMIGLWAFIIGLVLAIFTVFVDLGNWVVQVLLLLGILTGIFHDIRKDIVRLGIIYLALSAVSGALKDLVLVGPVITDIVAAWVGFLGPVVLTALLVWGTPYLLIRKKS